MLLTLFPCWGALLPSMCCVMYADGENVIFSSYGRRAKENCEIVTTRSVVELLWDLCTLRYHIVSSLQTSSCREFWVSFFFLPKTFTSFPFLLHSTLFPCMAEKFSSSFQFLLPQGRKQGGKKRKKEERKARLAHLKLIQLKVFLSRSLTR